MRGSECWGGEISVSVHSKHLKGLTHGQTSRSHRGQKLPAIHVTQGLPLFLHLCITATVTQQSRALGAVLGAEVTTGAMQTCSLPSHSSQARPGHARQAPVFKYNRHELKAEIKVVRETDRQPARWGECQWA